MTFYLNLSSLAWAALAAFFVARYADRWASRVLAVYEARNAQHTTVQPSDGPGTPMPDDLLAMINELSTGASESDEILRQQTVALLYEKCAEFGGDWDKVKAWSAVNIASDIRSDGWGHS